MGSSKTTTTTVAKRDPEPAELTNLRTSIYNAVSPLTGASTADATWNNSLFGKAWNSTQSGIDQANKIYNNLANDIQGYTPKINTATNNLNNVASQLQNLSNSNLLNKIAVKTDNLTNTYNNNINNLTSQLNSLNNSDILNNLAKQTNNLTNTYNTNITDIANQLKALSNSDLINKINSMADKSAGLADNMTSNNSAITGLSQKIANTGDTQYDLANTIKNFTETGNIPQEMLDNLNKAVNSELQSNGASALNSLASRGVLNSSVTNRSLNALSNSAADAYAKNYLNAYNAVLSGYGQTNNTLASTADTYSKAMAGYNNANNNIQNQINAYNSAGNLYNQSYQNQLNALNNAGDTYNKSYQNQLAGYNQEANLYNQDYSNKFNNYSKQLDAYNNSYQNQLNAYNQEANLYNQDFQNQYNALTGAGNLYSNTLNGLNNALSSNINALNVAANMPTTLTNALTAQFSPAYNFWKDWQNSYDNREDYDTVVTSGGK